MTTIANSFNVLMLRAPLQKYFSSIWAYHLIDRLEYWFSHDKFQDTFYKFAEPCQKTKHFYKEGDSWSEVLGISRKVFNKTFDLVGIRYSSETAFRAEADPFKGKFYASYHNRQTHQTFYVRNHHMVHDFLTRLSLDNKLKLNPGKQTKHNTIQIPSLNSLDCQNHVQQNISKITQSLAENSLSSVSPSLTVTVSVQDSGNGTFGHSPTGPNGRSIYIQANTNNLSSTELTLDQLVEALPISPLPEEDIKKMVDIWKDIVGNNYIPKLSRPLMENLKQTLIQLFDNCLDKWQAYCQKIASSKFLMGEKTSFKAWFTWAIKPDIVQRIIANGFSFGDRQVTSSKDSVMSKQQKAEQSVQQQTTTQAQAFHRCLLKQGGTDDYLNWFEHLEVTINNLGQVRINCSNRFVRDKLTDRFGTMIASAIQQVFGVDQTYQLAFEKS